MSNLFNPEVRIVAFIDILGFKKIVYEKKDKAKKIMRLLDETVREFIELYKEEDICNGVDDGIEITWFSDSIIISDNDTTIHGIYFFLSLIQSIQSYFILEEVLIRGGISLGECYHGNSKVSGISNVFGEAMIDAYKLESKSALYPRIILSEDLVNLIKDSKEKEDKLIDENFESDLKVYSYDENLISSIYDKYSAKENTYFTILRENIIKDSDGWYYINYLEEIISRAKSYDGSKTDNEIYLETVYPIKKFIEDNLDDEDKNVRQKYIWLAEKYNDIYNRYNLISIEESKKDIISIC